MTNNVADRQLTRIMPLGLQVAVLAALSASGTLATNILLPSLPGIAIAVGVSSAQVTAAITIFLAMFALGQLVVGPLSDRFGRRVPVMTRSFLRGAFGARLLTICRRCWPVVSCRPPGRVPHPFFRELSHGISLRVKSWPACSPLLWLRWQRRRDSRR